MYSTQIKDSVQALLDSNISATIISDKSNVNVSVVKKLKSNLQSIDNTNFDSISKLYNYYLDNQQLIDIQKEVDPKILNQKLPNKIIQFLNELSDSVDNINYNSVSRISEVFIYDKYTLDHEGNSKDKSSFMKVDESIPITKDGVVYNYQISINNEIDCNHNFSSIENLKIVFNRELLEVELKKQQLLGSKIKLNNPKNGNSGIRVVSTVDNTDIYNFESNYFSLNFKEV